MFDLSTRSLAAIVAVIVCSQAAAHGPVARKAESVATAGRLFTADSASGAVVAVDLPEGKVVARLATPPYVMSLGLSGDRRHLFAMRGRDTDRDVITVIDTGVDAAKGTAATPLVARSFIGNAPGGVREGSLSQVGGRDAIFMEGRGELQVLEAADFTSLGAVPVRTYKLAAPDHYHYLEAGDYLYVGHLRNGMVQILDRGTGAEVGRIGNCPVLHGMARDEPSGRLFFACSQDVLVVGTLGAEANREVARIPYPEPQRIGVFLNGSGRVLWGNTEGALPLVYRFDAGKEPYVLEKVPVDAAIQQYASPDGRYLLVYSRSGVLDVRDGGTGQLIRQVTISKPFDSAYHEHVDKALLPDIQVLGGRAFVSIPPEGVIVELDVEAGKVLRRIQVGGQPTRMVLLAAAATP